MACLFSLVCIICVLDVCNVTCLYFKSLGPADIICLVFVFEMFVTYYVRTLRFA